MVRVEARRSGSSDAHRTSFHGEGADLIGFLEVLLFFMGVGGWHGVLVVTNKKVIQDDEEHA